MIKMITHHFLLPCCRESLWLRGHYYYYFQEASAWTGGDDFDDDDYAVGCRSRVRDHRRMRR